MNASLIKIETFDPPNVGGHVETTFPKGHLMNHPFFKGQPAELPGCRGKKSPPFLWFFPVASCPLRIQSPCQMMIGVYNHLLSKVFRFHYHSQKVIGSLGV